jgi:transposase-like protein/plasmid maintenance system killer protein
LVTLTIYKGVISLPKLKFDENIKLYAVELYENGLSAPQVASRIGANEATIRQWVKDRGMATRIGSPPTKFSEEIIRKIISMYSLGMYTSEIDAVLNLKRGVAAYLLRKNGVCLRHRGPKSKIYNEDYFDIIDTEEKAYFLGWIVADGNISITNNQYCLKLHIGIEDKELIDKFLYAIQSTNKTKIKEGIHTSYYVSLTSVHMCKTLMNLGIVPGKSGKEVFPTQIPGTLYKHFIRGIFDGDGITDVKRKRSGFVGSENIVSNIMDVIGIKLNMIRNKKNENIFYYLGGKKYSKILYEFLYNDATIWLNRKRQRMDAICFK